MPPKIVDRLYKGLNPQEITFRLTHLSKRLRLRSPATKTEIVIWAELRKAAEDFRKYKKGEK